MNCEMEKPCLDIERQENEITVSGLAQKDFEFTIKTGCLNGIAEISKSKKDI